MDIHHDQRAGMRLDGGPFAVGTAALSGSPALSCGPRSGRSRRFEDKRNFTWTARSAGLCMTAGALDPRPHGASLAAVVLSFELSEFCAPVVLLL